MADYRQGDRDRTNAPRRDSSIFSTNDRTDQWREDYQRWSSGPSGRQEPSFRSEGHRPSTTGRGDYRTNQGSGSRDDRGFFDRAGDELRSWFGDEEAERRREADARRYEREHGTAGAYRGGGHEDQWTGGSPERSGQYSRAPMSSSRGQSGGYSQDQYGQERYGQPYGGQSAQSFGTGQQGDQYSRGQSAAHGGTGQSYGQSSYGQSSYGQSGQAWGQTGQAGESRGQSGGASHHDENYRRWRDQQISALDRDYEEYCRQRQQQFEQDFSTFRQSRQAGITSGGPTMSHGGAPRGSTEIASSSGAASGMGATTSGTSGSRNAAATTTGAGSASAATSSVGSTGMAAETGNTLTGAGAGSAKSGKRRS
ncbi:MAG TPA: SWFGD domain-containing protein [Allosphingosinicella sp.]|nr:SWFGD domain-containing protein [Allosphingosinicella sp.]